MTSKTYGYVRVSTKEQHEDRQMIALQQFPVPPTQYLYGQTQRQGF